MAPSEKQQELWQNQPARREASRSHNSAEPLLKFLRTTIESPHHPMRPYRLTPRTQELPLPRKRRQDRSLPYLAIKPTLPESQI